MSEIMAWLGVIFWGLAISLSIIKIIFKYLNNISNNNIVKSENGTLLLRHTNKYLLLILKYFYKFHIDLAFIGLIAEFIHSYIEYNPEYFNITGFSIWILLLILFLSGALIPKIKNFLILHRITTVFLIIIGTIHILNPYFSL